MAVHDLALNKAITPLPDHWNTSNPTCPSESLNRKIERKKESYILLLLLLCGCTGNRGGSRNTLSYMANSFLKMDVNEHGTT